MPATAVTSGGVGKIIIHDEGLLLLRLRFGGAAVSGHDAHKAFCKNVNVCE